MDLRDLLPKGSQQERLKSVILARDKASATAKGDSIDPFKDPEKINWSLLWLDLLRDYSKKELAKELNLPATYIRNAIRENLSPRLERGLDIIEYYLKHKGLL